MKKSLTLTAIAAAGLILAGNAFAGDYSAPAPMYSSKSSKMVTPPPPPPPALCFNAGEFQLGTFYSANAFYDGDTDWVSGAGVDLTYWFIRYVGVQVEGNWAFGGTQYHNINGSIVARIPIEPICLAFYGYGGGGVFTDGQTVGSAHVGLGVEWRPKPLVDMLPVPLGIFVDARHTWLIDDYDYNGEDVNLVTIRAGVRITF